VRTAIEGIVSLLASRSMIKGELGAEDRTMVASRDNNPLKLMPDINDVMQFLFENKQLNSSSYLPPMQSIQGACEDLIFHEMGTAAGMRAAVEGSIRRFDPRLFEAEFEKSGKKMVLNRKANLWEMYVENYSKIEKDLADDVARLFEQDFRRAYDEQVRKLKKK
jgi:type VI secretion system FHA domain protein